jgi:LPXTG-motif cell wall-anchored protein
VKDNEEPYTVYFTLSSDNYNTYTNAATVTITRRPVTLTSASATKTFDNTPLTAASDPTVTAGSWADGEGDVTFTVTGSQTVVGSSENTFDLTWSGTTKESNYNLTKTFGTLTVSAPANTVVFKAKSGTWTYDGAEHTLAEVDYNASELVSGATVEPVFSGTSRITAPGQVANKLTAIVIKDADGKNYVTSDAKGYIAMKGLDAGVYVLREIDAPLGYTFDPSISYRITITPTYALENPSSTDTGDKNQILASYTVEVEKLENGASLDPKQITTSTYTVQTGEDAAGENTPISFLNETFTGKNPQTGATTTVDGSKLTTTTITLGDDSESALIVNKKLGILPATGGSGIIFYLVAGGLLAGTAAILINKDRKRSIA